MTRAERGVGRHTPEHRAQVARLVAAGAETRRFRERIAQAYAPGCNDECEDEQRDFRWMERLAPDAFVIADNALTIYEVVVTHDVPDWKQSTYADLWFWLDYTFVSVRLVIVTRDGHEYDFDLMRRWYDDRSAELRAMEAMQ